MRNKRKREKEKEEITVEGARKKRREKEEEKVGEDSYVFGEEAITLPDEIEWKKLCQDLAGKKLSPDKPIFDEGELIMADIETLQPFKEKSSAWLSCRGSQFWIPCGSKKIPKVAHIYHLSLNT